MTPCAYTALLPGQGVAGGLTDLPDKFCRFRKSKVWKGSVGEGRRFFGRDVWETKCLPDRCRMGAGYGVLEDVKVDAAVRKGLYYAREVLMETGEG